MGTLASIEYGRGFSEEVVYDIKRGGHSILAAAGYFAAALLEPAGIKLDTLAPGIVDIADETDILCPFTTFQGSTSCVDIDGTMATSEKAVVYECWTQVHGRLKRLVVHPRLRDIAMYIHIETYSIDVVNDMVFQQRVPREQASSRKKHDVSADGKLDGSIVNVSDRIAIMVLPKEPTKVRSTDFLVLMHEIAA